MENEYVNISLKRYDELKKAECLLEDIKKDLSSIISDMRLGYNIISRIYSLWEVLEEDEN